MLALILAAQLLGATSHCDGPNCKGLSLSITITGTVVSTGTISIKTTKLSDKLVALESTYSESGTSEAGVSKHTALMLASDANSITIQGGKNIALFSSKSARIIVWDPEEPLPDRLKAIAIAILLQEKTVKLAGIVKLPRMQVYKVAKN